MSTWTDTLTMDTMAKERANPPFDVRKMSIEHHGSENDLVKKEKFMLEASRDPVFYSADIYDLTKEQIRERTMQRIQRLAHYVTSESVDDFQKRMELMSLLDPGLWTRLGVHYGLFLGAIRSGATPNQFSYWMEKGVIGCKGMFGCFGMTELAHGSNVAGLETTAHFDAQTDEFVIHTPNLGATKWWIGGAAQTATHCSVFAQLIVKGKRYGTKTFIVPLRDPKSFQLLPGINIGDIGKKMGRDGIDNGYIQFTNVRIPRAYMLMKHTQVTRDGEVREPPLQQLTYGALLQGRTAMVADAANTAKKALTISVRYAAARRQFKSDAKAELETQILDYPIHQRRLMPLVAQAVAFGYTALELQRLFEETSQALEALEPGDPNLDATIEKLKETHSTSAGLKAFCTWATLETIDRSRQACGGHGYSSYNGFASMYSDFAVHCLIKGTKVLVIRNNQLTRVNVEHLRTGDALLDEQGRVTRIHTPVLPVEAQTRAVTGQAEGQQVMAYEVTPGHLLSLRCESTPYQIHTSPQLGMARMQWAARDDAGQIKWRWTDFTLDANDELVRADVPSERTAAASGPAAALTPTVHAPGAASTASARSKSAPTAMASSGQPQLLDSPPASPLVLPQLLDSPPASPKVERARFESFAAAEQINDGQSAWCAASENSHSQGKAAENSAHLELDAQLRKKCAAWFKQQPDRVQVGDLVDISADAYAVLDVSHPLKSIFGGFRGCVADAWPEELANAAVPAALQSHYERVDPYFLGFWLGSGSHNDAKIYSAAHQRRVIDRLRKIYEPQGFEVREEQAEVTDGRCYVSIIDSMPPRAHGNRLLDALDAFGLTGEQGMNKHIPPAFLYASADVRRQVLAGLLDSDGCLSVISEPRHEDIHVWQFVQPEIRDRLLDDVFDLGHSLGLVSTPEPERFHKEDGKGYRSMRLAGPGQELVSAHIQMPTKRLPAFEEAKNGQRKRAHLVVERKSPVGADDAVNTFYSFQVDGNTKRFLLADWTTVHNCTWEGDNTILALQSGRFLISAYQDALDGKKQVSAGTNYLNDIEKVLSAKCESNDALDTLEGIDRGWATVAAHAVKKASDDYQACLKAGRSREQAFEDCSQVRFVAASVHTSGYIFRQFRSAVERVEKSDDGVREHLELLAKFYGLWQMEEKAAFFLRSGWLTAAQLDYASAKVTEYCAKTRTFAIPLIDSFAISDHVLNSPIGRYDGDIYREYFRMVRRNNPQLKEHPYFERLIRPFIERETAEIEDYDEAIGIDDEIEEIKQDREEAEAEAKAQADENKD